MFLVKGVKTQDLRLLAEELGETVDPKLKFIELKEIITNNKEYKEDAQLVKELLTTMVEERKSREGKENEIEKEKREKENEIQKEKREKQYEIEREKLEKEYALEKDKRDKEHELELAKLRNSIGGSSEDSSIKIRSDNSIEKLIKSVKTLSIPVPTRAESWNVFFSSLERAFKMKNVPEDFKAEVLVNILGERATNCLIYVKDEELSDYEKVKDIILREFQPTPQACLEGFRRAKRLADETHSQFASRLMTNWKYYCTRRKVTDIETLHRLIVADKLFQTLDNETATHIAIKQGEDWLEPIELAKCCDIFFASRGNSFVSPHHNNQLFSAPPDCSPNNPKYVPPPLRSNQPMSNHKVINKTKSCYICASDQHIVKYCPKRHKKPDEGGDKSGNVRKIKTEALTARVHSSHFESNNITPELDPLQVTDILVCGKQIPAVIDSATQITILNKNIFPNTKQYETHGKILLTSAFGERTEATLYRCPIALYQGSNTRVSYPIDVLVATTEKLNILCLLTPAVYDLLKIACDQKTAPSTLSITSESHRERQSRGVWDEDAEQELCLPELFMNEGEEVRASVSYIQGDEKSNQLMDDRTLQPIQLKEEQMNCETLKVVRQEQSKGRGGFELIEGLLYHKDKILGEKVLQLVLPLIRRAKVLELAHTSVFGSHMGIRKTKERIRYSFYWPNMAKDIEEYCKTCSSCQLRKPERINDRAPITPVLRPSLPFEVINIDVLGPVDPPSARGYKYILCVMDQHTRWPEAVPMTSLSAKAACDALLQIFARTGIPNIVASDQGTNFTSSLTQEFLKRIGASPRFSCVGYPASNGLVERFIQVLKNMLHHVVRQDPRNWDKQLPFLLFAYREVPNSTTGVSPFKLLYGREARGPLAILKSTWSGEISLPLNITQSATDYLQTLKIQLETAAEMASLTAHDKQQAYAEYFNRRSSVRKFEVGDQVFLLIPDSSNKIYARWTGPGEIVEFCPPHSYKVKLPNGSVRHVHINKIRKYHPRVNAVGVIFEDDEEFGEIHLNPISQDVNLEQILQNLKIDHLEDYQQTGIKKVLRKHRKVITGNVGIAKTGEHKIKLKPDALRKKPHIYRIPESLKEKVDEQIEELLALGLIEESTAEIAYPVVCVSKKDGGTRLCVDYRFLNDVTISDDFPMQDAIELIQSIGRANVITTLDLLKGYWAIPMEPESRDFTSFKTHRQQYRFKVMSYGLKNAAATFQREINRVLAPYTGFSRAYIDDIAIFSEDLETHLKHLDIILTRLEELKFTVNLKKCRFAMPQVKYLGHIIGSGRHQPDPSKIDVIAQLERPVTKTQLRSVLGLCNYYREYIDKYVEIAFPLTELTKKTVPEQLPWGEKHDLAFQSLKQSLIDATSLHTPVLDQPFIIQSDASQVGIAACLSQRVGEKICPISYASQKLTKSQQLWSTIEREAYAIVWSLKKFETLVFGAPIEFYTDHNPLTFLTKCVPQSARLQRWALAIQKYNITVHHRPGKQMANVDALSRL